MKRKLRIRFPGLPLLMLALAMLAFTGCGTALLQADFERDRIGSPPALSPVGSPDGDAIFFCPGSSLFDGSGDRSFLVERLPSERQALSFDKARSQCGLYFYAATTPAARGTDYWFLWSGVANLEEGEEVAINVSGGHFRAAVALTFRGQSEAVEVYSETSSTESVRIGTVAQGSLHTILIRVKKSDWTYMVSVFGTRTETQPPRSILDSSAFSPGTDGQVSIQVSLPQVGGSGSYLIDSIKATVSCPDSSGDPDVCDT